MEPPEVCDGELGFSGAGGRRFLYWHVILGNGSEVRAKLWSLILLGMRAGMSEMAATKNFHLDPTSDSVDRGNHTFLIAPLNRDGPN